MKQSKAARAWLRRFWKEEDGIGTLEIIMIVAVLVVVAIAFRKWIMKWLGDLFNRADQSIDNFNGVSDTISPPPAP